MGAERLCFGTSTFAAGRLGPNKPSGPGIAALRAAIDAGVRLVHSNPKLGTQWAIRRALSGVRSVHPVQHLIKVEAPLEASLRQLAANIDSAIATSMDILGVQRIHAVVLEIDLKRTERRHLLDDAEAIAEFYAAGAWQARVGGAVSTAMAYCHRPSQVRAALRCEEISGIAARYNLSDAWAAGLLGEIADTGRDFIGTSPLGRGALVIRDAPTSAERLAAFRWAVSDPRVRAVAVTVSSASHLHELLNMVDDVARGDQPAPIGFGPSGHASLGAPQ